MKTILTSLLSMRRTPYQTIIAITLIALTSFVAYLFSLFLFSSYVVIQFFEASPQVMAYFELDTQPEFIADIAQQLQEQAGIDSVTVVTQQEALEFYREQNQDNPFLLELVTADILPASLEVSANSAEVLRQVRDELDQIERVESVILQQDLLTVVERWTRYLRILGVVSVGLLATLSLLLVIVIISLRIVSRRGAIGVMRLLGADRWFIQAPYLVEGWLYGVFGAMLGWVVATSVVLYATPNLQDFLGEIMLLPFEWQVFAIQLGVGVAVAGLLGMIASWIAVGRLIKQ